MKWKWSKVLTLPVLALSLFLWSCDDIGRTTQPEGGLNPRGYAIFSSTMGRNYVVVREAEEFGVVSATIGNGGGEIHLGSHTLTVPVGAVRRPAVFTMSRADGDLVRIQLSATRVTHNDAGAAGFHVPVRLTLDFGSAEDLPEDLSKLEVLYFRADGLVDPKPTYLDLEGRKATGELPHFSDFGLGWPF